MRSFHHSNKVDILGRSMGNVPHLHWPPQNRLKLSGFVELIELINGRGSLRDEIGAVRKTCCLMPVLLAWRSEHNSDGKASFSDFPEWWRSDSDSATLVIFLSWYRLTENSVVWFKDTCLSIEVTSQFEALFLLYRIISRSVTQCFSFAPFLDEIVGSCEENEYISCIARLLLYRGCSRPGSITYHSIALSQLYRMVLP